MGSEWIASSRPQDRLRRLSRPPVARAKAGELAPISLSRLNYNALRKMDIHGHLQYEGINLLDALDDETIFRKTILTSSDVPQPTRISKHMMRHLLKMLAYNVVTTSVKPLLCMPLFCVPKKDPALLRLILDCRILNAACKPPPPMELPTIHNMIDYIMNNEWACQSDAHSWFYQFPLCHDIMKYFGARISGSRGNELLEMCLASLPMGWSWAPSYGQRTSNVLVDDIGKAWVDNAVLAAKTKDLLLRSISEFRDRCARIGADFDLSTLQPSQTIEAIGVECDLKFKQYRLQASFVEKFKRLSLHEQMTVRELYVFMGSLFWAAHVRRRPLCAYPHAIDLLIATARFAETQRDWKARVDISQEQMTELQHIQGELLDNEWIQWIP